MEQKITISIAECDGQRIIGERRALEESYPDGNFIGLWEIPISLYEQLQKFIPEIM